MILADTSAWVEYDRATGSKADQRIAELINADGPLMFTEPILMELLAGARSDAREQDLRRMLLRFDLAHFDAVTDFDAATKIYRRCRKEGVMPRGMIDCMIAAVAHRRSLALLAWDADMFRVAKVIGIELDQASLRA
jgi:predicted nucleic acid-binding protein